MLITVKKWTKNSDDQYWINLNTLNDEIVYHLHFQDRVLGAMIFQDIIEVIKKYYNCRRIDVIIKDDCIEFYT